jgi:hypothetical protein
MVNPIQHFLHIAPINREARQVFNDVTAGKSGFADNANLPDDLDRLDFARKFMFIESYHEPAKEAVKEGKVDFHQSFCDTTNTSKPWIMTYQMPSQDQLSHGPGQIQREKVCRRFLH